jgi:hypothetical protein
MLRGRGRGILRMDDVRTPRTPRHRTVPAKAAAAGIAAILAIAGCSGLPPAASPTATTTQPAAAATIGPSGPAASTVVATVVVSTMTTSVAVIPDLCEGPGATPDKPNRYTFTIRVSSPGAVDATERYAPALLGKVAHLTLNGPPDAGSYDAPIVHGPGGAGLSIIASGGFCQPDGFSTLASLTIDGVPLTQQPDGTWLGSISVN